MCELWIYPNSGNIHFKKVDKTGSPVQGFAGRDLVRDVREDVRGRESPG